VKYRLLDVTVIIRKTLVYSVVTGTMMVMYLGVIALFARVFQGVTGTQTIFSSAVAAGLITLCFQPLRRKVEAFVDAKFFRQFVDREEKLYELSREVITHATPEAMAQALVHVLQETLHPKGGALYLKSRDGMGFVPTAAWGNQNKEHISDVNPLASYFVDHTQPFVQEIADDMGSPMDTRKVTNNNRSAA
jgi:two-component system NtrC family sensor kinase